MSKTILITGSTDGIGLEAARKLLAAGQEVILHGRNPEKLARARDELGCDGFVGDLSDLVAVNALAGEITDKVTQLDVLINNAGILKSPVVQAPSGRDIRFEVNTIAPCLLTRQLLPIIPTTGRILNLSSAAQAPVDPQALRGEGPPLSTNEAYAQSKLAITMWSIALAEELGRDGPLVLAINPGSLLGSKMVKEGYGIAGKDIGIGADILLRATLSPDFADKTGQYWDNDSGQFAPPHPDALDAQKRGQICAIVEELAAG